MSICDGHLHFITEKHKRRWGTSLFFPTVNITKKLTRNIREFIKFLKKKDIIKTNLLPLIFLLRETKYKTKLINEINKEIYHVVNMYPHILDGFFLLNDEIDEYKISNENIKGIKLHFYVNDILNDIQKFKNVFLILEKQRKSIIIHDGYINPTTPDMLLQHKINTLKQIILKFPNLKVIVAHSGRTFPFSAIGIEEFLKHLKTEKVNLENVYFDTSTIRSVEGIKILIENVGIEKIIFGTDYPFCKDKSEDIYNEEIKAISSLPPPYIQAICCDNFKKLFYPSGWWIRRVLKEDRKIINLLENLAEVEKKYLALNKKMKLISEWIKTENSNFFIIEEFYNGNLCGYLRFSDRKGNGVFLEELVIFPNFRRKGYAKKLIQILKFKTQFIETKVLYENVKMKSLLKKCGFNEVKKGKRITLWRWEKSKVE